MPARDTFCDSVTHCDASKTRCVTPQTLQNTWFTVRVTHMTHFYPIYVRAQVRTRMQNSWQTRHHVSSVTRAALERGTWRVSREPHLFLFRLQFGATAQLAATFAPVGDQSAGCTNLPVSSPSPTRVDVGKRRASLLNDSNSLPHSLSRKLKNEDFKPLNR